MATPDRSLCLLFAPVEDDPRQEAEHGESIRLLTGQSGSHLSPKLEASGSTRPTLTDIEIIHSHLGLLWETYGKLIRR